LISPLQGLRQSNTTTLLVNFAAALDAYASAHHGIRDTMKVVWTREESLDDVDDDVSELLLIAPRRASAR